MDNINKLISDLGSDVQQGKKPLGPISLLARWLLGCAIWLVAALAFWGVRKDITVKFASGLFTAEIISLALVVISAAIAVTFLSYPDMRQKPKIVLLPLIPLAAFIGIVYYALTKDIYHAPTADPGYMCLICISAISSVPALLIFVILRRQATTHPFVAGFMAMLASSALGNLIFRLSEPNDNITHLITWHYFPIIGFSLIGILIGRKILKW